ncbi:hypothetical protein CH249_01410 [Rhodococcus sp. 05-2255-3B1]|uniref:phytanoyl-CoA dioxygenase family protein n=1 Tax=unclassified Rhodococcus (in: high G+C Gram-positive bacteria) TaxID=192944 RepID=UPI000B9B2D13|nr:hypothetical protein CH250_05955 [Rhodococcus sp. 05-2255-3C]OZE15941.1 hypothetical protein CH249_01410 [Rhodococcus sp. 05-2255-3B1]OZE18980.1 hypothetical protein CH255_13435 [Rhodococcus sp. 05-2255-2A2]
MEVPSPTVNRGTAAEDLRTFGYCVVADVLNDDRVHELKSRIRDVAEAEQSNGSAWTSNGNQKVFNLINQGSIFLDLVEHPIAIDFACQQLGPDPLLSSLVANIARPGNKQQQLHADQQYVPDPWPNVFSMNIVWALDDFTEENGATVVVPGSHRDGRAPYSGAGPLQSITGPAGSMVVLDGRVWHAAGANRTASQYRTAVLAHYCAPYIRQQENVFRSIDPEVRRKLTPTQRKLLGYDIWSGLGVVNGTPRDWVGRTIRSGPTNADQIFDE